MSAALAILILVGAIGAIVVVGIALLPFFVGLALTMLATGIWEHFGGSAVAFGSTALPPEARAGLAIFRRACASCHRHPRRSPDRDGCEYAGGCPNVHGAQCRYVHCRIWGSGGDRGRITHHGRNQTC